jgi:hypothetical protein
LACGRKRAGPVRCRIAVHLRAFSRFQI